MCMCVKSGVYSAMYTSNQIIHTYLFLRGGGGGGGWMALSGNQ